VTSPQKTGGSLRTASAVESSAPVVGPDRDASSTRERILDIALDLFIEQGFDKTSLRQIAEKLGFSKAALYYHFASKDDILMALHLRLHDLGKESLSALGDAQTGPESWVPMLESFISLMMANRKVFVLHERNQAAFENLHRQQHDDDHTDLAARFREVLSDPSVAVDQRVRMACALGAVMGGLVLAGDAFAQVPSEDLGAMLRGAIGDVLGGSRTEKPSGRVAKGAPRPKRPVRPKGPPRSKGPARAKGPARPNGSA
jgi:AcrR family transcriptional regulator